MRVHLSFPGREAWEQPSDWSPDNRYILSSLYFNPGEDHLVIVDVETNEMRVLRTMTDGGGPGDSFFSPDGRFVAFSAEGNRGGDDIFLVSSDGARETDLVRTPDDEQLLGWLPDGSGILFHRRTRDSEALWKLPVRDGEPSGPPELVKDDVWQVRGLGFSDDAYFYGVTVGNSGVHIASIDPETGRVLQGLTPVSEVSGTTSRPGWSPDGRHLAYVEEDGNEKTIVIRAVTGEVLQELRPPLTIEGSSKIFWTAYGLLLRAVDREGRNGLQMISLETGEVRLVREEDVARNYIVSADGSKIFSPNGDRGWRGEPIIELDLATGTERTLVENHPQMQMAFPNEPDAVVSFSRVSPDGNNVAYLVRRNEDIARSGPPVNDGWAVEISSRVSGEVRATARLASFTHSNLSKWSRDGRYLFFVGMLEEGGSPHLMRLSVDDGSLRSFRAIEARSLGGLSISADGRHIAVVADRSTAEIWRMTFNSGG